MVCFLIKKQVKNNNRLNIIPFLLEILHNVNCRVTGQGNQGYLSFIFYFFKKISCNYPKATFYFHNVLKMIVGGKKVVCLLKKIVWPST